MRFRLLLLSLVLLFLAACSQVTPPATNLQVAAAEQMPLPSYSYTFQGDTRGFWFQAPVDFRITGLRVPNEGNQSLQNVEVFKLSSPPPEFPTSATGGQVFYKTGVPSGDIIETDLSFAAGDYVGILGAAGDANSMYNSYANESTFDSSVLGEPVVLRRFLTQSNIVASGGNQPYSTEANGNIARVEVYVESPTPPDTTKPTITLTTPADNATYQQNESVTVSYSCADEEGGSGLKSCTGTLENGSTLDTSTPGSYSFTVNAEDNAGNTESVTHSYTVAAPQPPVAQPYTVDFEKTVANKLVYSVKVGSGVTYQGQGSASNATVPVVGKRASNGKILEAQVARVVSIYGSKRLIAGSSNTSNTPNATGGRIKLTFTNFDSAGARLTSVTLSNLVKRGAYLTFYYVDGSSSRQNVGTTSAGGSLVVPLSVKNLRALDVYAPNAYAVDDVMFEVPTK